MKILLAVDDDPASAQAATKVGEWFPDSTEIIALHVGTVVPSAAMTTPVIAGGIGYPVVALPYLREERHAVFREAREIAEQAATITDGTSRTATGDPARQIVEVAEETQVDLIVIGTGDRSWLSRLFNPSVSNAVLHQAPCSVLVVRPHDDESEEGTSPDAR